MTLVVLALSAVFKALCYQLSSDTLNVIDCSQGQYAKSIWYINPISGTKDTATQLNRARAKQTDVPFC
eukprot:3963591-Pleurochrysis_carterae.AAC.3